METVTQKTDYQTGQNREELAQTDDLNAVVKQIGKTFQRYARERPDVVALWSFGIGVVVGWKLKPW